MLTEAVEIRRTELGAHHRATGISANNLAATHFYRGRLEDAMRVQELALRALEQSVGRDHQRTVVALSNLASFRVALGEWDAAERDYRELLDRQARLQGRDHPVAARVTASLASVVHERGAATGDDSLLGEAEALYREAIRWLEQRLGADHPQTAQTRARLSAVLLDRGDARGALQLAQRATAALQASGESNGRAMIVASNRLALAYLRNDALADAERVQRKAVADSRRVLGESHAETGSAEGLLCEILIARGEWNRALTHCDNAERILRQAAAGQRRRLARVRLHLAHAYMAGGAPTRADSVLSQVSDEMSHALAQSERRLLDSLAQLRRMERARGD